MLLFDPSCWESPPNHGCKEDSFPGGQNNTSFTLEVDHTGSLAVKQNIAHLGEQGFLPHQVILGL